MSDSEVVGNKAKVRISKRVFQENKARQIFRKTNISYPLICVSSLRKIYMKGFHLGKTQEDHTLTMAYSLY